MTKPELNEDALDALFDAARDTPEPSFEFLARLEADADAVLSEPPRIAVAPRQAWIAEIGGWFGLSGLVAATCAGIWIGISPPAYLPDPISWIDGSSIASVFEDDLVLPFDILEPEES